MFIKTLISISLLTLLSSCASIEDFQKMSPDQRATKVCSSNNEVRNYKYEISDSFIEKSNLEDTLMRGYNVVESCSKTIYKNDSRKNNHKERIKTHCREEIIPLNDYLVERYIQRIETLEERIKYLRFSKTKSYEKCFSKSLKLTPEQAYSAY